MTRSLIGRTAGRPIRPDDRVIVRFAVQLVDRPEMGEGLPAPWFVGSDPLFVGRGYEKYELVVGSLPHTEQGAPFELDRFGVGGGLEVAFVRAPLDVSALRSEERRAGKDRRC